MPYISSITLPNGDIYDIKNTTYSNATTAVDGLLSAADKIKLDSFDPSDFTVSTVTATLPVAGWSNNTQTITVAGVTATNTVLVTYAPTSKTNYINAGIYCTAQGDGTLTFVCVNTPTVEISVNVIIYINTTISNASGVSF